MNGLISAVHLAHAYHIPICFSPDHFWALITSGFCQHMKIHHEDLKCQFVSFDGKKELIVQRDEFIQGSPNNDWTSVFSEFSNQIKDNIGIENHEILVPTFSTTDPTSQIVHELSLMNAMKQ